MTSPGARIAEQIRAAAPQGTVGQLVRLSLAYFVGAEAAFFVGTLSDRIFAPFWPPNVILFYVLLMTPPRRWWMFIGAAFPAHVVAEIRVGMPPDQYLVAFATNVAVATLNAYGARRFMVGPHWLGTLRQAGAYVLITIVVSPAICALGGAFVPLMSKGEISSYWQSWVHWYASNALGCATLGPFLLTWLGQPRPWGQMTEHRYEAGLVLVALVIICAIAFGAGPSNVPSGFGPALLYLPLPLVIWAAVRFGDRGASTAILIVTLVSIWRSLNGSTFFDSDSAENNALALQVFLTALAVPSLLLGAAIAELRRAEGRLQALAGALLREQDQQRRGIARELHDGTGQSLAGAALIATRLRHHATEPMQESVGELTGILQQSVRDLRTLSQELHPPLLDEMGLVPALRAYVTGISERHAIAVELVVPVGIRRLPGDIELALFRVVEEALSNVCHHSASQRAIVSLVIQNTGDAHELALIVRDFGRGFVVDDPMARGREQLPGSAGFGLRRMSERLRQLDGRLEVSSAPEGTIVAAIVPLST